MVKHRNFSPRKFLISFLAAIFFIASAYCQDTMSQYRLYIHFIDKDSSFNAGDLNLTTSFPQQLQCLDYINKLPQSLNLKGYLAASVDEVQFDSVVAKIDLFVGQQQKWIQLNTDSIDKRAMDESGFIAANFTNKPVNFTVLEQVKERIISYYEKNGYPFASVYLDSVQLKQDAMEGLLKVRPGPLYHIDSIRVIGKAKLSNNFLQHYLSLYNGAVYNKQKLEQVSKRMLELPYVQEQQPSELIMLGTGSVLNLYLQPKKSSQVNFLIGFLPANNITGKLQLTGDINLNLKNALGKGETILVNWQQLQLQSPRLNIGYQHPFIFNSAFGIDFSFELFKKDSAFLQLNAQFGLQYLFSANQTGKIFIQRQSTSLLASGIDTNLVKITKKLPLNIDVSAVNVGLDYEWNNTNYRLNPKSGNEIKLTTSAGIKTIQKNNDIVNLADPGFNYASLYDSLKLKSYQLRAKLNAAHYFPAGKRSTLKTVLSAGVFSSPNVFRNELFQIGGYKLLRGFDEESIYASRYMVATAEYRYLVGLNSYLFCFSDAGWVKNKYQNINANTNYISAGIGMLFETKVGLLNMSFAMGKRSDLNFDMRRASKIHFGYINYF